MPRGYSPGRNNWTQEQVDAVEEMLRRGFSDTKIGRRLHRTATAVKICRRRRGLGSVSMHTMSGRHVARLLGRDSGTVAHWCRRGWLRAQHSIPAGTSRRWMIEEDDLVAFLADPSSWMLWRPDEITDLAWREWALELPRYRWLTPGQVARRYAVGVGAVNAWIHAGLLPSVRRGNHWIAEPALAGFELPCERSRAGISPRRFSAEDDRRIIALRAAGETWVSIAAALGRPIGSVHGRWRRIGGGV